MRGRAVTKNRPGLGYSHIHTAIDAYSRLAYSEFAGPETADNCVAFLGRAVAWFAAQGITIDRVLTDNGVGYRSLAWARRCAELGIRHSRTRPYRPATNGKAERFNRTLTEEWAYARLWTSDASRARALDPWLHRYNNHRHHTAIGGPPTSRCCGERRSGSTGAAAARQAPRPAPDVLFRRNSSPLRPLSAAALATVPSGRVTLVPAVT